MRAQLTLWAVARDVGVLAHFALAGLPVLAVGRRPHLPLAERVALVVGVAGAWQVAPLAYRRALPVLAVRPSAAAALAVNVALGAVARASSQAGVVASLGVGDHELPWEEVILGGGVVHLVEVGLGHGPCGGERDGQQEESLHHRGY